MKSIDKYYYDSQKDELYMYSEQKEYEKTFFSEIGYCVHGIYDKISKVFLGIKISNFSNTEKRYIKNIIPCPVNNEELKVLINNLKQ